MADLLLLVLAFSGAGLDQPHVWKATGGASLRAYFVKVEYDRNVKDMVVALKEATTGKPRTIRLACNGPATFGGS